MPKQALNISELNDVINKTIESLEDGKTQIFEISEQALNEHNNLEKKLHLIQFKITKTIDKIEALEKLEKKSRKELMLISKNFNVYSEQDIQLAYEKVKDIQVKLALQQEKEKQLIAQRTEIEHQIKNMKEIVKRSDYLAGHVGMAMSCLTGSLYNISDTIEDLQKKELLGAKIIMAQEEERQRISRDIHDGPAQSLTSIVIKGEICEKLFDIDSKRTKAEIAQLKKLARDSLKEIRGIIFDLRPMSLDDLGLVPTLEQYITKFIRDTGIDVTLNLCEKNLYLPPVMEVAVFRIIQEALNNIKKHSQATWCEIEFKTEGDILFAKISDNGVGFDVQEVRQAKKPLNYDDGFGIYNMQQRAQLLKGKLSISSEINTGTTISLQLPIQNNEI